MKIMKFIYRYILILSTLMLAASCVETISDEDILAGRGKTTIEVSYALAGTEVKSLTVASASVKKVLEVTVNNDNLKWNLESDRDWCEVVPEDHRGSGTVTLNIAANEDFESREPATLTFVAGDYRGFEITVSQNAASFIIGQSYFVSGIDGNTYTVNVTTPAGTDWDFTAEDWMDVTVDTPFSDSDLTTTAMTIRSSANDGVSRYGSIVLSAGEDKGYINVYQFGTELTYDAENNILLEGTEGSSLTLTAPAYTIVSVRNPNYVSSTLTENEDGTSTVNFIFKENLSDCSESRYVELSLLLSNASSSVVELPGIVQNYIPANGLVTGKGMLTFAKAVAEGKPTTDWEDNGVVTVKGEIDMSEVEGWTGIGTEESPFTGKFDGGKYEITKLKNTSAGLFAYCEGATIQNVVLGKGCSLYYDKSYTGLGGAFGGIVSVAKETKVTACQFDGDMDFAGTNDNDEPAYVGGIVGYADEKSTVEKSKTSGKILVTSSDANTKSCVGGIVGMSEGKIANNEMLGEISLISGNVLTVGGISSALPEATVVSGNSFMGTLSLDGGNSTEMVLGGLYGRILADRSFDQVSDKSVTLGNIKINAYNGSTSAMLFAGGFVGRVEDGVALSFKGYENQTSFSYDQTVNGRATSYACFGGLLGGCDPNNECASVTFESCSNQGIFTTAYNSKSAVYLSRGFVGGIAGFVNGDATFTGCTNLGELGKTPDGVNNSRSNGYFMVFGGIAGVVIGGDADFSNCENKANVTNIFYSNHYVGNTKDGWIDPCTAAGILGAFDYKITSVSGNLTINECVNSAQIKSLRGNVGGILGFARNASVTSCSNTGDLARYYTDATSHDAPYKGGIATWIVDSEIRNCVAKCLVYGCGPGGANQRPGGILALADGQSSIDGCSYFGDVKSLAADGKTPVCGGIVSVTKGALVVKDCKFGGTVDGASVSANNVASLAVGGKDAESATIDCTGITLWNGTL